MFYRTETKLQGWRALAIFEDGSQCLIYLGRSTTHVRAGYAAAFMEILDDEERAQVRSIALQCWQGAADEGRWITKANLNIPSRKPVPVSVNGDDAKPSGPPFRIPAVATDNGAVPAKLEPRRKVVAPTV